MSSVSPEMRRLARWLLEREAAAAPSSAADGYRAVRVCESFRNLLSAMAGVTGYATLLSRALALAKAEAPSLGTVQVMPDGTLEGLASATPQEGAHDPARDEEILVAHLLNLLATFIGHSLTFSLVRDLWPNAPYNSTDVESETR